MIGKVIAYGATRDQAIRRMRIALSEMVVEGIQTNIPLHQELLLDARFVRGGTSIHYLEKNGWRHGTLRRVNVLIEITRSADERDVGALSDALIESGALSVLIEDALADTQHEQPLYGEPGFEPEPTAWAQLTPARAGTAGSSRRHRRSCRSRNESGSGYRAARGGGRHRLGSGNAGAVSANANQ